MDNTEQTKQNIPSLIRIEILQALLSEVNPSLRGVAFEWNNENKFAFLFFYNDGQVTDALEDHYSCIDNEASTRFFFDHELIYHDFKVVRIDCPQPLPEHDCWVYLRREPFVDPS